MGRITIGVSDFILFTTNIFDTFVIIIFLFTFIELFTEYMHMFDVILILLEISLVLLDLDSNRSIAVDCSKVHNNCGLESNIGGIGRSLPGEVNHLFIRWLGMCGRVAWVVTLEGIWCNDELSSGWFAAF